MIDRAEARKLLKNELTDTKRIRHSLAVAKRMESLSRQFGLGSEKWYLTGLLHDIDLEETMDRMEMHGIVAKEKLKGLLPRQSIEAIMAHDRRTGCKADTRIAGALVFCDLMDNLSANVGMAAIRDCRKNNGWDVLIHKHRNKEHHIRMIREYFEKWPGIRI